MNCFHPSARRASRPLSLIALAVLTVLSALPAVSAVTGDAGARPDADDAVVVRGQLTVRDNCAGDVVIDGRRIDPRRGRHRIAPPSDDDDAVHVNAIVVRGTRVSSSSTWNVPCSSTPLRKESP